MSDKPHPASIKKKLQAKQRGEYARSRDINAIAVMGLVGLVLWTMASAGIDAMTSLARTALGGLDEGPERAFATAGAVVFFKTTAPVLAAGFVAALGAGLAQSGGRFSLEGFKFDPTRLNPLPKLQKMFASPEAAVNLGTSVLKVAGVAAVCVWTLFQELPALLTRQPDLWSVVSTGATDLFVPLSIRAFLALGVLAAIDYAVNRFKFERDQRMSTQEVRDEIKEEFGDPMIRQRRRRQHQAMARQRSVKQVPQADVVLVNPSHYAVAIKYSSGQMGAPRVLAKGVDGQAERIRTVARQSGVPIVSQPPLTRALYRLVDVGHEIPEDFYQAVALVLAHVYRVKGSRA